MSEVAPDTEDTLPPYEGILLSEVRLVRSKEDAEAAMAALLACDAIGFDTESKPTFRMFSDSSTARSTAIAGELAAASPDSVPIWNR